MAAASQLLKLGIEVIVPWVHSPFGYRRELGVAQFFGLKHPPARAPGRLLLEVALQSVADDICCGSIFLLRRGLNAGDKGRGNQVGIAAAHGGEQIAPAGDDVNANAAKFARLGAGTSDSRSAGPI